MDKNKKLVAALLICVFMVTALTGCGKERMMFGTGGTAGTYYAYGGIIAQYMTNYAGVKVTAVSTGGSTVNIQSMQDGDYQMGFAQTDVMTYAWDGTKSFESYGENHDFRVLGGLYAETVYYNAVDVLTAAGITLEDIKPQYQSFEDSKEALKDGKIQAAFIVAGAPTTAITELATTNGVYLVNIDGDLRDAIIKEHSYYSALQIPADTYPGQTEPVETLTVKATVIVDADLDENTVYNMTAAIFDHADEIAAENAKGNELTLDNATSGMTVPFHKGAARYYKEHGMDVDTQE